MRRLATLEQPERQKRVDRILCYKNLYETISPQELWICLALHSSNPKPSYDPPSFPRDSGTNAIIRRENPLRSFGTWSRTHPRQALSVQLSHDGRIEDAVDYGGVSKEALAITFESLAHLDSFITDNGIISLKPLYESFSIEKQQEIITDAYNLGQLLARTAIENLVTHPSFKLMQTDTVIDDALYSRATELSAWVGKHGKNRSSALGELFKNARRVERSYSEDNKRLLIISLFKESSARQEFKTLFHYFEEYLPSEMLSRVWEASDQKGILDQWPKEEQALLDRLGHEAKSMLCSISLCLTTDSLTSTFDALQEILAPSSALARGFTKIMASHFKYSRDKRPVISSGAQAKALIFKPSSLKDSLYKKILKNGKYGNTDKAKKAFFNAYFTLPTLENRSNQRLINTVQDYFIKFIEEETHETVRGLVQFATACTVPSRNNPINIYLTQGDQNALPNSHTCFNRLDIETQYFNPQGEKGACLPFFNACSRDTGEAYELFSEKLKMAIELGNGEGMLAD